MKAKGTNFLSDSQKVSILLYYRQAEGFKPELYIWSIKDEQTDVPLYYSI